MSAAPIDYGALAQQFGGKSAAAPQPQSVDYGALARQYGGTSSAQPAAAAAAPPPQSQQPSEQGSGVLDYLKRGANATLGEFLDPIKGAGEEAADLAAGVGSVAHRIGESIHPGLGEFVAPADVTQELRNLGDPANGTQRVYKGLAGVAEFMMGDEALKGASVADKLAKIAPVVQKMSKSPELLAIAERTIAATRAVEQNRFAGTAIRQAVVGGAQGAAHGDSAEGAGVEAALAGAGGVLGEGAGAVYDAVRPGERVIAGVPIKTLASQDKGAGKLARAAADIDDAPEIRAEQQAGSQQAITNVAQKATRDALQAINASRAPIEAITDPGRLLAAPEDMAPYRFDIHTGEVPEGNYGGVNDAVDTKPVIRNGKLTQDVTGGFTYPAESQAIGDVPQTANADGTFSDNAGKYPNGNPTPRSPEQQGTIQYTTGVREGTEIQDGQVTGSGVYKTADPAIAQKHLSDLNEAIESGAPGAHPQVEAIRDRLQEQLDLYHAARTAGPKFSPIDTEGAARQVATFKDASDQIQASVQPVYQKLDKLSGGTFKGLRNQQKAALKVIQNGTSVDDIDAAQKRLTEANQGIDELFVKHRYDIDRSDYAAAQQAWSASKVLDQVHATVEGLFNGVPSDLAAKYPKEFSRDITKANASRLAALETRVGPMRLEAVLGKQGLENLYRVTALMQKPATANSTNILAHAAAKFARLRGFHVGAGAVIGGAVAQASGHPWVEGAEVGAGAGFAGRYVLRQMATNPRVGQLAEYAVKNGVTPRVAGGLIGATLAQGGQQIQEPTQ